MSSLYVSSNPAQQTKSVMSDLVCFESLLSEDAIDPNLAVPAVSRNSFDIDHSSYQLTTSLEYTLQPYWRTLLSLGKDNVYLARLSKAMESCPHAEGSALYVRYKSAGKRVVTMDMFKDIMAHLCQYSSDGNTAEVFAGCGSAAVCQKCRPFLVTLPKGSGPVRSCKLAICPGCHLRKVSQARDSLKNKATSSGGSLKDLNHRYIEFSVQLPLDPMEFLPRVHSPVQIAKAISKKFVEGYSTEAGLITRGVVFFDSSLWLQVKLVLCTSSTDPPPKRIKSLLKSTFKMGVDSPCPVMFGRNKLYPDIDAAVFRAQNISWWCPELGVRVLQGSPLAFDALFRLMNEIRGIPTYYVLGPNRRHRRSSTVRSPEGQ